MIQVAAFTAHTIKWTLMDGCFEILGIGIARLGREHFWLKCRDYFKSILKGNAKTVVRNALDKFL